MFTEFARISCSVPACRLGSAQYQTCWIFQQPSTTPDPDPGSAQLETFLPCLSTSFHRHFPLFLYCYCPVWKHLLACHGPVSGHHSETGSRTIPTVLERKPACCKQPRPDLIISHQHRKSLVAQSVTLKQKKPGTPQTRRKRKPTRQL